MCVCVCELCGCECVCGWVGGCLYAYCILSFFAALINLLCTVLLLQLFLLHPEYHYLRDCVPVSIWQE